MKLTVCILFLSVSSINCQAGIFKDYKWGSWNSKEILRAYDSEWLVQERSQILIYSPWHISRWFIWQNYRQDNGKEVHLVNEQLGFNENVLDLIAFPQKDGSYKSLLKKTFLDREGSIDYYGSYGIYEENGSLWVWLHPDSETATDHLLPPYTDCGFLTAKEKVAYAADRRHEPEVYHGEFDLNARKFYIRYASAPIQYVYWSEWGGMTSPFMENRSYYRKPSVWDATQRRYVPGDLEAKPEYVFLGGVESKAVLPIVCSAGDFLNAKSSFQSYLRDIWQPAMDKELSRMSEHEKATFKREDCDGAGLNYDFGCKQIENYGRNDGTKNRFPKRIKPPRIEDRPD